MANETKAPDTAEKAKTITVTATTHLVEAGVRYAPGDSLEVTPARAKALGEHVKPA